jgi:hypothetical protein
MSCKIFHLLVLVAVLIAATGCSEATARESSLPSVEMPDATSATGSNVSPQSAKTKIPRTDSMANPANISRNFGRFNFEAKTVLLNSGYHMPIVGIGTY